MFTTTSLDFLPGNKKSRTLHLHFIFTSSSLRDNLSRKEKPLATRYAYAARLFSYLKIADVKVLVSGVVDKFLLRNAWDPLERPRPRDLPVILIAFHQAERFPHFSLVEMQILDVLGDDRRGAGRLRPALLPANRHHAFVLLISAKCQTHVRRRR